jgi:cytoskeleton protein RodZ
MENESSSEPSSARTARVLPAPGVLLRQAREQRGVTLKQAAEATRISERYLRALEEDAPLDDLLNPAYARLFLKNYAKFLNLDPDEVAPPPVEHPAVEPPVVDVLRPAMRPPGRVLSRLLVAAAVAALVFLGITRNYGRQEPRASTPPPAPPPTQSAQPSPSPSVSPSPPVVNGLQAQLKVTARSWVSATADGKNVIRETVDPPRSLKFNADRDLELIFGNAGGVELLLNGETVPTGGSGEVVHLSFSWRNGEVVMQSGGSSPSPNASPSPAT